MSAVDQSGQAVTLTAHNAQKLGLLTRLTLVHAKVERHKQVPDLPHTQYDIIVANPPYVPARDLLKLEPEIYL